MKIRPLLILMLVLFAVFAAVSLARGERNDKPTERSAASAAPAATSEPARDTAENSTLETAETSEAQTSFTTVDAAWFDDAAFVGDSVTLKLSYYAAATGCLGNAQFFASGSLGSANAMWELSNTQAVHPSYQGQTMLVEDCVATSGATKLFIMLGMNDIAVYGIDGAVENYQALLERILTKSPGLTVYVQSMTPTTSTSSLLGQSINSDNIRAYNDKLQQLCRQQGWHYVDVASVMYDESGQYLRSDYCSDPDDMGVHFTETGCQAWVDYLYGHVA